MDRETRRIAIGLALFAIGLALLEVSGFYQRLEMQQLLGQNGFCGGPTCVRFAVIEIVGQIGGGVIAFAGMIVALVATFRKIGQVS